MTEHYAVSCVVPLTQLADRALRPLIAYHLRYIAAYRTDAPAQPWRLGPLRYGLFVVRAHFPGKLGVRHTLEGTIADETDIDALLAAVALAEPPDGSWAVTVAADVLPICDLCRRTMGDPTDPTSTNCGGTCWGCMREAEDCHVEDCSRPSCCGECRRDEEDQ